MATYYIIASGAPVGTVDPGNVNGYPQVNAGTITAQPGDVFVVDNGFNANTVIQFANVAIAKPAEAVQLACPGQGTGQRLLLADARGTVWRGSAVMVLTGGVGSREVIGAVRTALDAAELVLDGWRCVLLLPVFVDTLREGIGRWRTVMRIKAVVEAV